MKNIYLLDHKIKFKTYKAIHDNIVKDPGPTPAGKDKILWEMIKNKQIFCWFDDEHPNDMGVGLKLPKNRKVILITNPPKGK